MKLQIRNDGLVSEIEVPCQLNPFAPSVVGRTVRFLATVENKAGDRRKQGETAVVTADRGTTFDVQWGLREGHQLRPDRGQLSSVPAGWLELVDDEE